MSVNPRVSLFHTITYTRDALGLAKKINNIAFTYDKNSIQTQLDYPNQSKEKNSFDAIYNIKKIESANQTLDYTQDKTGLITKKNNANYTYDKIGRLTKAGAESFSYDKAGNNLNDNAVYNILNNRLNASDIYTITYDSMGNIKSKYNKLTNTTSNYTFNSRNQLVSYEQLDDANQTTKTLTYTYDAFNRRVSKTEDGVEQKYLYDGDDIVAILDNSNQVIATITHDESIDTPLSITNANGTFYYHRDHQGSIVALTNSSGTVVESFVYDNHYGAIISHTKTVETNNPYAYTGRELDTEELYYYRARYYDPSLQRFLGEDLIGFASGDSNFYRYVKNSPVTFFDPSGLKPDKDKIYMCTSSSFKTSFHAFPCAGGKCSGLYPNPYMPYTLGIGPGYVKDDTKDFDNPDYDCRELDQSKPTCNKEGFKKCMLKFINTKGVSNNYPYNYLTHNCRTTGGSIALLCQIENGCY